MACDGESAEVGKDPSRLALKAWKDAMDGTAAVEAPTVVLADAAAAARDPCRSSARSGTGRPAADADKTTERPIAPAHSLAAVMARRPSASR